MVHHCVFINRLAPVLFKNGGVALSVFPDRYVRYVAATAAACCSFLGYKALYNGSYGYNYRQKNYGYGDDFLHSLVPDEFIICSYPLIIHPGKGLKAESEPEDAGDNVF